MKMMANWRKKSLAALLAFVMVLSLMVAAFPLNVRADVGPEIHFYFGDGNYAGLTTRFDAQSGGSMTLGALLAQDPIIWTDEHEHSITSMSELTTVIRETVEDAPEILGYYTSTGKQVTDDMVISADADDIYVYPKFNGVKVYELTATVADPNVEIDGGPNWTEMIREDVDISQYSKVFYGDEGNDNYVTSIYYNVSGACPWAGWFSATTDLLKSTETELIFETANSYDKIITTNLFRSSNERAHDYISANVDISSSTTVAQALAQNGEYLLRGESALGAEVSGWSRVVYENGEPVRDDATGNYRLEDKVYTTENLLLQPINYLKPFHFMLRTAPLEELSVSVDYREASWPVYEIEEEQNEEGEWAENRVLRPIDHSDYFAIPVADKTFGQVLTACGISTDREDPVYKFGERTFKGWAFSKIDPESDAPMQDKFWEIVPDEESAVYTWEQLQALPMSTLASHAIGGGEGWDPEVYLCAVWEEPASQYVFPFEINLRGGEMDYTYQYEWDTDEEGKPIYETMTETTWGLNAVAPYSMTKVSDILKNRLGFVRFDSEPSMTISGGQAVDFLGFVLAEIDANGELVEDEEDPGNVKSKDGKLYSVEDMLNFEIPDAQSATKVVFAANWDYQDTPIPSNQVKIEGVDALLIDANRGWETPDVKTAPDESYSETNQYFFADNRTKDPDMLNRGTITLKDPVRKGYTFKGWEVYRIDKALYYGGNMQVRLPKDEELIGYREYFNDGMPAYFQYYVVKGRDMAPDALMTTAEVNTNIVPHPDKYRSVYLKAKWAVDASAYKIQLDDITSLSTPMAQYHDSVESFIAECVSLLTEGYFINRLDVDSVVTSLKQVDVYKQNGGTWHLLTEAEEKAELDAVDVVLPLPEGYKPGMTVSVMHVMYVEDESDSGQYTEYIDVYREDDIEFVDPTHIKVVAETTSPFLVVAGNLKAIENKLLAGSDRYETCARIAKTAFDGVNPNSVIFVTGANFPDALTANGFAGAQSVPVLMTRRASVPDPIKKLLKDDWNGSVKSAYVIGGGFEQSFFNELKALGVTYINNDLKGSDRYKTADAVLKFGMDKGLFHNNTLVVATGAKAADALSMSSYCYAYGYPMVLTNKYGELRPETKALIKKYGFKRVVVAGAEVCCKTSEMEALGYSENKGNLIRLAGSDRYATSVEIAKFFIDENNAYDYTGICLAPGGDANFPDALVGGMLAGMAYEPMVLVGAKESSTKSYDLLKDYLKGDPNTSHIYSLGFCKDPSIANRIKAMLIEVNSVGGKGPSYFG
ncbi:MAG: cell wall-binding repeat-containing protein [Lachnospiraceae bacterium]|nr:cell wall-binding repeat-containing protein [Lachnospiraceae bacterium]